MKPQTYVSDTPTINICECTRHSDVWFDDGSIVLCVEKNLFRVHRTILCSHSEIFSDMFGLPRPLPVDEHMIEGCPVVWLPDRACDVEQLLKAMYNPL
jgi:BTB/POZ domain